MITLYKAVLAELLKANASPDYAPYDEIEDYKSPWPTDEELEAIDDLEDDGFFAETVFLE